MRATEFSEPLAMLLEELSSLIADLSDDQYLQKPVGPISSNIGAHVRHCLDHVRALLLAVETAELNYDQRDRGTSIESDRLAAQFSIALLVEKLRSLTPSQITESIDLEVMLTAADEPVRVTTTVGRELAFVLSHTIHHNAIVAACVKTLGGTLPERFGYAPATLAHEKRLACAQ